MSLTAGTERNFYHHLRISGAEARKGNWGRTPETHHHLRPVKTWWRFVALLVVVVLRAGERIKFCEVILIPSPS